MSTGTTLLIDDNENDVALMVRAISEAGLDCEVRIAPDGRAALDYLGGKGEFADRANAPFPELILLDLKLPVVPGIEVLEWIRGQQALSKVVVIVLTGSRDPVDHNRAYRLGANSIMEKPPTAQKIIDLVQIFHLWGHSRDKTTNPSA